MLVRALRSFPYSRDGVTALEAAAGATVDIPDLLVEGLTTGGWIASPDTSLDAARPDDHPEAARRRELFAKINPTQSEKAELERLQATTPAPGMSRRGAARAARTAPALPPTTEEAQRIVDAPLSPEQVARRDDLASREVTLTPDERTELALLRSHRDGPAPAGEWQTAAIVAPALSEDDGRRRDELAAMPSRTAEEDAELARLQDIPAAEPQPEPALA